MTRSSATRLLALGLCAVLGACVVIDSDRHTRYEGRYVSDQTLAQVRPGSTQEYVLALLGEPTRRNELSDGSSIWRWSFTRKVESSSSLILVFSGDSTTETQQSVYVEFDEQGLVRRSWRD